MARKKSPSAPAAPPGPRKRTASAKGKAVEKAKKKAPKKAEVSSNDSESEEEVADAPGASSGLTKIPINWKDPACSEKLLALIGENKSIKQALYPPCSANASTKNGGGKKKVEALWKLCLLLLEGDDKYTEALAAATAGSAKDRSSWANKIKARLRTMAKISRKHDAAMGETGAGIDNVAQIDRSVTTAFTTKWDEIEADCPWYFEMRNLISERPNLVLTGLGDSTMPIDMSVIMAGPAAIVEEEEEEEGEKDNDLISGWNKSPTPEPRKRKYSFSELGEEAGVGSDYKTSSPVPSKPMDDDEPNVDDEDLSGKGKKPKKTHRPAKPSTSTPAPPPIVAPKPVKKSKLAEFGDIAKQEELSHQKALELASLQTQQAIKATEIRGQLGEIKAETRREGKKAKQEERMMKLRIKELKLRNAHERQMARPANFFDGHSSSSGSRYMSPGGDSPFDTYSRNATAGPSTFPESASLGNGLNFDFGDSSQFGDTYSSGASRSST
ncbi:hypothetical protein B0H10DRAFT_2437733 [Mycena sp. CBHHK59/15]|nr:hypothetical protein B0H10DRAFT_2437733 [Mycena sp. CBHHK59/15]